MQRLENMLAANAQSRGAHAHLDGEQLFLLHDTYGCPPDLILDILRERGLSPAADASATYDRLMDQ
jgi:alanyl-tRNA synthetase